jgi:hypothetical protein
MICEIVRGSGRVFLVLLKVLAQACNMLIGACTDPTEKVIVHFWSIGGTELIQSQLLRIKGNHVPQKTYLSKILGRLFKVLIRYGAHQHHDLSLDDGSCAIVIPCPCPDSTGTIARTETGRRTSSVGPTSQSGRRE